MSGFEMNFNLEIKNEREKEKVNTLETTKREEEEEKKIYNAPFILLLIEMRPMHTCLSSLEFQKCKMKMMAFFFSSIGKNAILSKHTNVPRATGR
jgi:hypothetical protein